MWMTTLEVAKVLGVSNSRVRKIIRSGDLAAHRIGGVWRIEREAVEDLIALRESRAVLDQAACLEMLYDLGFIYSRGGELKRGWWKNNKFIALNAFDAMKQTTTA